MSKKIVTKTFEIEASEDVMQRLERFLALLHWNSQWGHSAMFGMFLDGDGWDKFTVEPEPEHRKDVDLIGSVSGHAFEVAMSDRYRIVYRLPHSETEKRSTWYAKDGILYKNGEPYK